MKVFLTLLALYTLASCSALFSGEQIPLVSKQVSGNSLLLDTIKNFGYGDISKADKVEVQKIWEDALAEYPELISQLEKLNQKPDSSTTNFNFKSETAATNWDFEIEHDSHPNYKLQGKKPDPSKLKVDNVTQYSGYIDVEDEDKHFFYWFFESRNDPANDPVILWLNGGPGCSSFLGLFFELGPSLITINGSLEFNPLSWNSNASVIFLDQPVNVGFSYSSNDVSNSWAAGKDVFAFLDLFFLQFPEYSHLDFHIAGESYAGVYIPVIANEILSHEDRSFNLTSILIGNGITDPKTQNHWYQPMLCGQGGHPQVIPDERCEQMLTEESRCAKLLDACYLSHYSKLACIPALVYCDGKAFAAVSDYNINAYDIRMICEDDCYPEEDQISKYLNSPIIQGALGVDSIDFKHCSGDVGNRFMMQADQMYPYQEEIIKLLDDHHLPVLIYAGDKDYICNWLGNEAWMNKLEYSQHIEFEFLAEKRDYVTLDGQKAGQVKNWGNFTFIRLFDAGHMVPHDQAAPALDMINRWINGDLAYY
ncbi:hypothetical protein DASC09_008500 [Saccharomycopsis crataegensis]|uniref:Carboxypeptidase n=1 Tax=Saccharomycopsis crataegensis TaxID=43959 RepID=A0AAV5QGE2_9ASCO|nr:hypothetical protein DASC09_008500 [Saccharomycopsis crataegensis]